MTGSKSVTSGKTTGSIDSGSAIGPASSYTIGNGSPQYRWRLNNQSRSLYVTVGRPKPDRPSHSEIARLASSTRSPSSETSSFAELCATPSPT